MTPNNKNFSFEKNRNIFVKYQTGDGFTHFLFENLTSSDLLVTNRSLISHVKSINKKPITSTLHSLNKVNVDQIERVILYTTLPYKLTRSHKELCKIVTGKSIVILHPVMSSLKSINSLLHLLTFTKNQEVTVQNWSYIPPETVKKE